MTSKEDSPKEEAQTKSYQKESTWVAPSNWVVDPRLKAASDKMMKALVDNLNRNTSG